ncbi:RusA-like resolvase [Arthrobacter phage Rizwana]|nr:RusA-like resolvase [Arthrobacter phage Rizwana]
MVTTWDWWVHEDNVMNANHTYKHWSKKSEKVEVLKQLGRAKHRQLGKHRRVRLDVLVSYPRRIPRDVNNLQPTLKHYIDGLVDIPPHNKKGMKKQPARGILTDDSDAFVEGPFMRRDPDLQPSGRPGWYRFRITMTDLD